MKISLGCTWRLSSFITTRVKLISNQWKKEKTFRRMLIWLKWNYKALRSTLRVGERQERNQKRPVPNCQGVTLNHLKIVSKSRTELRVKNPDNQIRTLSLLKGSNVNNCHHPPNYQIFERLNRRMLRFGGDWNKKTKSPTLIQDRLCSVQ